MPDAIFGNQSESNETFYTAGLNRGFVSPYVLLEQGTIFKISSRVKATTTFNLKGLIYANNAGVPGALLAVSEPVAVNDTLQFYDMNFTTPFLLDPGTYWLGQVSDGGGGHYASPVGGIIWRNSAINYATPVDPFGGALYNSYYNIEVYATYTPTPTTLPYPVSWLKKKKISGYHVFLNQYIRATKLGYLPLKLPDGTVF